MKRSEMIDTMVFNWCENINKANEYKSLEAQMKDLLDVIEKNGMLPPFYLVDERIPLSKADVEDMLAGFDQVQANWEPEDET